MNMECGCGHLLPGTPGKKILSSLSEVNQGWENPTENSSLLFLYICFQVNIRKELIYPFDLLCCQTEIDGFYIIHYLSGISCPCQSAGNSWLLNCPIEH